MGLVCLGSRYLDHISLRGAIHYAEMWFTQKILEVPDSDHERTARRVVWAGSILPAAC